MTINWIHIFEIFTILLVLFAGYRIISGFKSESKLDRINKNAKQQQRSSRALINPDIPETQETALNNYIGDFFATK